MEIKELLSKESIIGVISNYKLNINNNGLVRDLKIKNINNALKMVGLDDRFLDKNIEELTISELWKIDLATKLDREVIIVGNLSNCLIQKDIEYMKKLFIKLSNSFNKKIVVIDNKVDVFFNLTKLVVVMKDKNIIYKTDNMFDDELYKYVRMPKIVEFIKYVNEDNTYLNNNIEIYELIKDIYRSVS